MEQFGDLESMKMEEVVGSLKAHEERIKGIKESSETKLMVTEEEWRKRESDEGKLLFTREEWLKKSGTGRSDGQASGFQARGVKDKCKIRCFNCNIYGHFAGKCRKLK